MSDDLMDLNLEVQGPPGAPCLLFVHPLGADGAFWSETVSALRSRFRTVVVDRRGSGQSPIPSRPWSLDDHARDLDRIYERLNLESAILVGVAAGTMGCVRYAATRPDRVAGLILSNPMLEMTDAADAFLARRAEKARIEGVEALVDEVVSAAFAGQPEDARRAAYAARFRHNDPLGYERTHLGMMGQSVAGDLTRVAQPVAIVTGARDVMATVEIAHAFANRIPQATFSVIDEAAHFPPIQDPAGFLSAIAPFLARFATGDAPQGNA